MSELKKETLRRKLPQGSTVYTVRTTPGSQVFILLCAYDGRISNITADAREACGKTRRETWVVKGHNFNHAGSIVEDLAFTLYHDVSALRQEGLNDK